MRKVLIASAALFAGFAGSVQPGRAAPFCLASEFVYGGVPDCSYNTWAQCRAAQPGVGVYCYPNTAAGYIFDTRDPANPRVVGVQPRRKPRAH